MRDPRVLRVSAVGLYPGGPIGVGEFRSDDHPESQRISVIWSDADFLQTLENPLLAGRDFDPASDGRELLLNEGAVQQLGFADAESAIGEIVQRTDSDRRSARIAGVVKDFHYESVTKGIGPVVIEKWPWPYHLMVRLSTGDVEGGVQFIGETMEAQE